MIPALLRSGIRYHLRHRWQLGLSLLGIALGVAVVVAVDIATDSASRAFLLSTEAVSGRATHEVTGGPGGLPEALYPRLRVELGMDSIAPVMDRWVRLPDHDGRALRVLGIDPFAERPFRPWVAPGPGAADVGALITGPAILLLDATAAALGLQPGDSVTLETAAGSVRALLAGTLAPADGLAREALQEIALTDIATAQELTGSIGVLDRIDVRVADDATGAARIERLRQALPPGARILETGARVGATGRLTRAFETNLTALALVALVFGMFLIYNSVTFSIVQRRPLIGLLRALGVTGGEVFRLIVAEAAIIGAAATVLGIGIGVLLGSELVRLVARSINDLYFAVSVTAVSVGAVTVGKALLLGVGATVLAALPPAWEAIHARPRASLARSTLERTVRRRAGAGALAGLAAGLVAIGIMAAGGSSLPAGFAALFIIILAAALLTPAATLLLMRAITPVAAAAGPVARMAARGVSATLSRTAPAIAALAVAIAVGIAVTIMIDSFRAGVVRWLDQTLQADVYIAAPGLGPARTDAALAPALPDAVRALPGVAGVTTYRHLSVLADGDLLRLIAIRMADAHRGAFELLDGDADVVWRQFDTGAVLVSEPLAYRRGLSAGDSITLPTDRGERSFAIAAVYRDYATEHGVVFIHRAAYGILWDDDVVNSLGVFLEPGQDAERAVAALRVLPGAGGASVRSNQGLRASTLDVFDRTFVITGVLRILALIVAFVGVTGALMALQLERAREIAVLRATGLTPGQVWSMVTAQTGMMGLAASAMALPLGVVLAWTMVHVINRRAFGWTFDIVLAPLPFAQALAVGAGAALLAGIYPAWRMARLRPADALRGE